MATRDHDAVLADNTDLRHELDMYKSVAIHVDNKPRTTITRIARPPLANQCLNISTNVDAVKGSTGNAQTLDTISANMTLDEIM
jgi:hypothetical protein